MERIESFKITRLTASGFKYFAEQQTFEFDDMNYITAQNAKGKSSIADAISYAITGVPFFGDGYGLDLLYNFDMKTKKMMVTLDISLQDGSAHTLTRTRENDKTSIIFDGIQIRQCDLNAMFGEKDVFLTIFNPMHFAEELREKGRSLIERCLPGVTHESVLAELSKIDRDLLEGKNMISPEDYLLKLHKDVREMENSIIYAEGQRDILESQQKLLSQKNEELNTFRKTIDDLETKRTEGIDEGAIQARIDDIAARHDLLSGKKVTSAAMEKVASAIEETSRALNKREAEQYISKLTGEIADASVRFEAVRKKYQKEKLALDSIKPNSRCPICRQKVTHENIGSIKESFKGSMAESIRDGNDLKNQLKDLNELEGKAKAAFEKFKTDDTAKLSERLSELHTERNNILDEQKKVLSARHAEMETLSVQMEDLRTELKRGALTPGEFHILNELQEKWDAGQTEQNMLKESLEHGFSQKTESIESIRAEIKDKRNLEIAVKAYIAERVKLMIGGLEMPHAKIVLCEIVKTTGEIKDVFRLFYDGKPYRSLSLSEKIKTGLEISELVKRLANVVYPIYIDNGESIPVIDNVRPSGQIFVAQVVKSAPLSVMSQGSTDGMPQSSADDIPQDSAENISQDSTDGISCAA